MSSKAQKGASAQRAVTSSATSTRQGQKAQKAETPRAK
jgi:hypothetical protein